MELDVMNRIPFSPKSAQRGVVLIEAMVAILLFSVGVLAVAGLQATMLQNSGESKYRADASYIAQQRLGLLWTDLASSTGTPADLDLEVLIPELLPNGTRTLTREAPGQFRVVVTWMQPGDTERHTYSVRTSVNAACADTTAC
jgi:type IV pilus assembly protein PilV